mmetsp:Transcript_7154/g.29578  ORF Transcript_7154/g.29578 Transcript_7154/m.29578 type:complete len:276 (+) Transcript_7154:600-1427(+)
MALPLCAGVSPDALSSTDGTVGCFFSSGVAAVAAAGAIAADLDLRYERMPPLATSSSAFPASASAAAPPARVSAMSPGMWSASWVDSCFSFVMNAVGAHARSATPHQALSVFPLTPLAIIWPSGVVAAPTAPVATAAGMSVTLFWVYAMLPAAVPHVTATTLVPMIFFAVMPSCLHAGTKTTAPPRPVRAERAPADAPVAEVNFHHPGLSGALTHLAMFDIVVAVLRPALISVLRTHSLLALGLMLLAAGVLVKSDGPLAGWNIRDARRGSRGDA